MSKRAIKRIVITVCLIILVAFFSYRFYKSQESYIESVYDDIFLGDPHTTSPKPNPNFLSDYPEGRTGGYQFDPRTIFESLDQGKDAFIPDEPNAVDVKYDGIVWTQSDFLRVANALSQKVWHEPLDLDNWHVYNIYFGGSCHNNLPGLNIFLITYYKIIKTGWDTVYTTRQIRLFPSMGGASWGGDGVFSTPFIFGWENIEFNKFITTADQAFRSLEANAGKAAQVNGESECIIYVYATEDSDRNYEDSWYVNYDNTAIGKEINGYVNPFTGEVYPAK